jgi:hypothetical protein
LISHDRKGSEVNLIMGGTVNTAMQRSIKTDDGSYVLTRNLISILENRRRELLSRLETKRAKGLLDRLQRRIVQLAGVTEGPQKAKAIQQRYRDPPGDNAPGSNVFRYTASRRSATPPAPGRTAVVEKVSPKDALRDVEPTTEKPVMCVSDILMAEPQTTLSQQMSESIICFIAECQGGEPATKAAASSVFQVLSQSLDTVLGVRDGQEMERDGDFITFMNNAFVKVTYLIYSNSVRGGFGDPTGIAGVTYVAEVAVIDVSELEGSEIDFLLSQAFFPDSSKGDAFIKQIEMTTRLRMQLYESAAVSRLLRREDVPIDQLRELMMLMVETHRQTTQLFRTMPTVAPTRGHTAAKPIQSAAEAALDGGVDSGQDKPTLDVAWNRRKRRDKFTSEASTRALKILDVL